MKNTQHHLMDAQHFCNEIKEKTTACDLVNETYHAMEN
jgi:hypothetical protein